MASGQRLLQSSLTGYWERKLHSCECYYNSIDCIVQYMQYVRPVTSVAGVIVVVSQLGQADYRAIAS